MRKFFAVAALAAAPCAAFSNENNLSYTYLEAGYVGSRYDLHTGVFDPATGTFTQTVDRKTADGWTVRGAVAIAPNFHLFGGYSTQSFPSDDPEQWKLGVGYNHEINTKVDLLTRVAYDRHGTDFASYNGWSVEAGARAALTPRIEGLALAGYQDFSGVDGAFYGRVGAQVKFNSLWGISGEVKFVRGDAEYFIGPRISF
jgi:Ax21 family sulfation-dependent quorum factor